MLHHSAIDGHTAEVFAPSRVVLGRSTVNVDVARMVTGNTCEVSYRTDDPPFR